MTPRHVLLAAGVAIAASLAFFGDKSSVTDIAEAVPHAAAVAAPSARPAKAERQSVILALHARDTLIGGAHEEKQSGDIFSSQTWTPPAPPPKPLPPPPPMAPPLPFAYLGKKIEDGAWEIYLARGDQTLIVREQTVVDRTYRVDSIKPPTLSLTYLPLGQAQTLTIGGID